MLFQLPDPETLYKALDNRDPSYDGRAFVAVSSTGIFCRLTCPARTPLFKNCSFYETVIECFEAGYRPCKRCDPTGMVMAEDSSVRRLYDALQAEPERRWREEDIIAFGLDPSTIRRQFKRSFGMTFLEMARLTRLRAGFTTLSQGDRVIDAQIDAGFESPAAFRSAFCNLTGLNPSDLHQNATLVVDWIDTPLGPMFAAAVPERLHLLEFADRRALKTEVQRLAKAFKGNIGFGSSPIFDILRDQLDAYFQGSQATFTIPLALHGTAFTKEVWRALQDIPAGQTRSYADLARAIEAPTATRAVARANGANQIAILIPCHRVIGSDGSLTGYGGGLWRKQKLLETEQLYK